MSLQNNTRSSVDNNGKFGTLRAVLWLMLVVSIVANGVASAAGVGIALQLGIGAVSVFCLVGLITHRLRSR